MADYVTLLGAEAVERAGHSISGAAQTIQSAVANMAFALEYYQRALEQHQQDEDARAEWEALTALVQHEAAQARLEAIGKIKTGDTVASLALRRLLAERGVLPREGG